MIATISLLHANGTTTTHTLVSCANYVCLDDVKCLPSQLLRDCLVSLGYQHGTTLITHDSKQRLCDWNSNYFLQKEVQEIAEEGIHFLIADPNAPHKRQGMLRADLRFDDPQYDPMWGSLYQGPPTDEEHASLLAARRS
jgi:hypothetical protein